MSGRGRFPNLGIGGGTIQTRLEGRCVRDRRGWPGGRRVHRCRRGYGGGREPGVAIQAPR